jgi:hypothetical protein
VLVFEHLWKKLGINKIITKIAKDRKFKFPVERVVFLLALQYIVSPNNDLDDLTWMEDYIIDGLDKIDPRQINSVTAWLGKILPEDEHKQTEGSSARLIMDVLKEEIFEHKRNLFTAISGALSVSMETTSISFEDEKKLEVIRGRICCRYLASVLKDELRETLKKTSKNDDKFNYDLEMVINDLKQVNDCEMSVNGKKYLWRSEAKKGAVKAFSVCGIKLPNIIRET